MKKFLVLLALFVAFVSGFGGQPQARADTTLGKLFPGAFAGDKPGKPGTGNPGGARKVTFFEGYSGTYHNDSTGMLTSSDVTVSRESANTILREWVQTVANVFFDVSGGLAFDGVARPTVHEIVNQSDNIRFKGTVKITKCDE